MKAGGALAAVLVIAACIARCPRTSVRAEGLVLSIAADRHALVIRRDDIVGATRGVPLSFTLDDPARLGDLAQGTAVRFVYSESFARLGRRLDEITAVDTALPMHDHRAQHGGIVAMIDRLHVEATATRDGRIRLWLTDFWRRPLGLDHTSGDVTIATGARRETLPLQVTSDALQATTMAFIGPQLELHATLVHDGAPLSADFIVPLDAGTHGTTGRTTRRCRTLPAGDTRTRCVVRFGTPIASVATVGQGDVAIVAGTDGQLGVWRPSTGELLTGLAPPPPADDDGHGEAHAHDSPVTTLSANGRTAFVAAEDAIVRYNLDDGSPTKALPLKGGHVQALAAAPDGGTVVVANRYAASAWLYDFNDHRLLRTIPAPREVTSAAWSGDGRVVAIGDEAGNVIVASLADGSDRAFIGLGQAARGLVITDQDVIGLGRDGTLAVWARDAGTARLRIITEIQNGRLAVSPESGLAAVASESQVQLYTLADGRLIDTIPLPHSRITGVALSANTLLLTDARGRLTIRDVGAR